MNTADVTKFLAQASNADRLSIVQDALTLMRQDWKSLTANQKEQQLACASELAFLDYLPGSALVEFTVLDGEMMEDRAESVVSTLDPAHV
jgi:hypothetical protein